MTQFIVPLPETSAVKPVIPVETLVVSSLTELLPMLVMVTGKTSLFQYPVISTGIVSAMACVVVPENVYDSLLSRIVYPIPLLTRAIVITSTNPSSDERTLKVMALTSSANKSLFGLIVRTFVLLPIDIECVPLTTSTQLESFSGSNEYCHFEYSQF